MAEPTLQEVFGASATQDATTITITKADLTGLTASSSNTAESLLAAILNKAKSYLTEANFDANTDQSVTIVSNADTLITRGTTQYRQSSMTVEFSKVDVASTFDPDDY